MPYKIIDDEKRLNELVNEAFGLEMIINLLECNGHNKEVYDEIKNINHSLILINRKIQKIAKGHRGQLT